MFQQNLFEDVVAFTRKNYESISPASGFHDFNKNDSLIVSIFNFHKSSKIP